VENRNVIFIEPKDLLIIPNKNELIRQTKTYRKYEKADTIVINNVLYTITLEFYDNKFHVEVYSSKLKGMALGEYQHFWNNSDNPEGVEHDRTLALARFIYDQIMSEVIEIARGDEDES
jgi:hypothetical protein